MLTPKRLAAALRDSPPKTTASTTRLRRSSESAIPAASFPRQESSIRIHPIRESPSRFSPFGYRSRWEQIPMRILFSSTKGLGHLRSLLPYALKAQSRGHSVCVATPDGAGPTLKGLGLAHAPFAAPADDDVKAVTAPWQGLPAEEFVVRFVKKVVADLRPRAALPALRQSIHEWRPDFVVRESAEFAAAIVAEEAGLAHARVAPHCETAEMGLIALTAEPIDEIRRETGLKPDEGFALRAAQGFTGFPASLDGAEPAHLGPPPFRVRESPRPTRRDGRPAPWAESDGRPLLYISFGTEAGSSANTRAPYRLVVETVSDMPVRALLTTGP